MNRHDVAPILLGIVPFGMISGASAVAAVVAAAVAWRTRSILWTLVAGMGVLWLVRAIT